MPLIPASSEGTRQDPGLCNKACGRKVYLIENSYILLNNACCFSGRTSCRSLGRSVSFFCVVRADEKGTVEGAEEPCSLVGVAPVPKASL